MPAVVPGPTRPHRSAATERLCQQLGLNLPIIQAPMAGVQTSALAIAVSRAGGLGSLPCAMLTLQALEQELHALHDALGGAKPLPYNVNFFCHRPPIVDEARESVWRQTLRPYYAEYDIDAASIPAGPGRAPFSAQAADLLAVYKPRVVSFHFGLPEPALLDRVKAWGATVLSSATTVDEALWLQAHGCDVIIAQGLEAGGHRGMFLTQDLSTQVGTFALLPQIVQAVDLPVIAAGGIADAAGVQAALTLGAAACQIGTAYMLTPQATTSALHRAALQSDAARHTALTNLFTGRPARGIVNRIMHELGSIHPAAPAFPLATAGIAPLRAKAEAAGRGDFSPLWSGQNAQGCKAIDAGDLTRELAG